MTFEVYLPIVQMWLASCHWHCCILSVGIALNVRFTMNGMCAKNNTHI